MRATLQGREWPLRQDVLLVALAAGGAVVLGRLAGQYGIALLAAVAGLGVGVILIARPIIGAMAFAVTIPIEAAFVVSGGMTATRLLGMVAFATWAAHKVLVRESLRPLVSPLAGVGLAFLGLAFASALWARYPQVSLAGARQLAQLFAWSLLVIDLMRSWRRLDLLVKAVMIGAVLGAAITVQQAIVHHAHRAGEDVSGGVNGTAVIMVTLVPFGFYLLRAQRGTAWRILGMAYIALATLGVIFTYSRMNFILLPPVLLLHVWQTLWSGRGRAWILAVAVAATFAGMVYVPWNRVTARVATIAPYLARTVESADAGGDLPSSRGYHLRVGLALAEDHPLLGVGYDNYGRYFTSQYQFEVRGAVKLWTSWRSPHSSHIGILANLGIVGLMLWLGLLGLGLVNSIRAWLAARRAGDLPTTALAEAVITALGLHTLAYGWYMPNEEEKTLWMFLAMSVVLVRLVPFRRQAT